MKPTQEAFTELVQAYDFFNEELFDTRLPQVMITLQRQNDSEGYFSRDRFVNRRDSSEGETTHEIALNPVYFASRPVAVTLSVLVRDMVTLDLLMHSPNDPPRRRYRNREWADACEAIGLMPSDTGKPGGKRTGDSVKTYIIDGGKFDVAVAKLLATGYNVSWADRELTRDAAEDARRWTTPANAATKVTANSLPELEPMSNPLMDSGEEGDSELAALLVGGGGEGSDEAGPDVLQAPPSQLSSTATRDKAPGADIDSLAREYNAPPPMKQFEPASQVATLGLQTKPGASSTSKAKYQCKVCKQNTWGKPGMVLMCGGTEKKPHDPAPMPDCETPADTADDVEQF